MGFTGNIRPGKPIRSREAISLRPIVGLSDAVAGGLKGDRDITVRATRADGVTHEFTATVRIDTPQELLYYRHGGILQYVLRQLLAGKEQPDVVSAGMSTVADPETGSIPT